MTVQVQRAPSDAGRVSCLSWLSVLTPTISQSFQCEIDALFADEPNPWWPDDEPDRDADQPE